MQSLELSFLILSIDNALQRNQARLYDLCAMQRRSCQTINCSLLNNLTDEIPLRDERILLKVESFTITVFLFRIQIKISLFFCKYLR